MESTLSKRCLAEFLGTFAIVFAPVCLSAASQFQGGDGSLMTASWVSGLVVMSMIYTFGHVSGAQFNPAVTLGLALAKKFPPKEIAPYIVAEMLGGVAAASAVAFLLGGGHGTHIPAGGVASRAVALEAILAFLLMITIMGSAVDKRANNPFAGIVIGLIVVVDVAIGGAISGGSMNPARSFGPALFNPVALANYWVYLVGPIVGALIAVKVYELVRSSKKGAPILPSHLL